MSGLWQTWALRDAYEVSEQLYNGPTGEIVILGRVDEEDAHHNCAAMGCGSHHVVWRRSGPSALSVLARNLRDAAGCELAYREGDRAGVASVEDSGWGSGDDGVSEWCASAWSPNASGKASPRWTR